MSWFNLGWTPEDTERVKKWQAEKGKLVPFMDETIDDPLADEISWVLGYPVNKQVNTALFGSITPPKEKVPRKRKPLTEKQRLFILDTKGRVCQDCEKDHDLQIHHSDGDRSNDAIENLIILCYTCHKERHKKRHARKITAT